MHCCGWRRNKKKKKRETQLHKRSGENITGFMLYKVAKLDYAQLKNLQKLDGDQKGKETVLGERKGSISKTVH